jgi:hypothetical protein
LFLLLASTPARAGDEALFELETRSDDSAQADGKPVGGVKVQLRGERTREVTTDAHGLAKVKLPAGRYLVVVVDPRFAEYAIEVVAAVETPLSLTAIAPATLSGKVVDTRGHPVAGAKLEVTRPETPSWIHPAWRALEGGNSAQAVPLARDGRFRLTRLVPGDYGLSASAPGKVSSSSSVSIETGQVARSDLVLSNPGRLVVRVLDGGKPVQGASVDVGNEGPDLHEQTDAEGRARFEGLAPGELRVHVSQGKRALSKTVSLAEGSSPEVTLDLSSP